MRIPRRERWLNNRCLADGLLGCVPSAGGTLTVTYDRATCLVPDPCPSCLSWLLGSPPSQGQKQKQASPRAWLCPASGRFLSVKNMQHQYLCSHFFSVVAIRFWTLGFPGVPMARILVLDERSLHSEERPHSGLPGPTSSPRSPALNPPLQACSHPCPRQLRG